MSITTEEHIDEISNLLDLSFDAATSSWHLDGAGDWTGVHTSDTGAPLRDPQNYPHQTSTTPHGAAPDDHWARLITQHGSRSRGEAFGSTACSSCLTWWPPTLRVARAKRQVVREMRAILPRHPRFATLPVGVTLRRRRGGQRRWLAHETSRQGVTDGVRDELQLPLDAGEVGVVPDALASIVLPYVRDEALILIAEVRTERTPYLLYKRGRHSHRRDGR